ncbi:hypothetical protein ACLESD_03890 [Pyxidicoccus sp. 3LFB2]
MDREPSGSEGKPLRQPLRIPGGWSVEHHELVQLEPASLAEDARSWDCFTEDLLQLREARHDLLLDAGWYPGSEPGGRFRAVLLRGQDWANPLEVYETRRLSELVLRIEDWLVRAQRL